MFEYNLKLSDKSYMCDYTLSGTQNKFSPFMMESGYFEAYEPYFTRRDRKDAALLIYTVSGEGILETAKQKYVLTPGSVILFKCNSWHYYRTSSVGTTWNFHWVHFDLEAMTGFEELISDVLLDVKDKNLVKINELFFRIDELSGRNDTFASCYRSVCVSELLGVLLNSAEESRGEKLPKSADIDKVIEYIDAHLSERINIDDLAGICHISKYHFIRLFHRCTGLSPYKYIMVARINKSKILLTTTRLPISEVAASVGFPETANFSKVFKSFTGLMPSAYRKEHYRW